MRYCAIKSCKNTDKNRPDIRFYEFPKSSETRSVWESFCGPSSASVRYICQEHFSDESWSLKDILLKSPPDKRRLKDGAIPVINLPEQEEQSDRGNRANIRKRKRLVSELVFEHDQAIEDEAQRSYQDQLPKSVATQTQ